MHAVSPGANGGKMKRTSTPYFMGGAEQNRYATVDEFLRLFTIEMADFYRLAFLLIADSAKTEECLVASMNECMDDSSVAREWIRPWSRRVLVRNAIRIMSEFQGGRSSVLSDAGRTPIDTHSQEKSADKFVEFAGVLALRDFERIVFVLCVLERYPSSDCALLLGRSQQDVEEARIRAAEQIAMYKKGTWPYDANPTNSVIPCSRSDEEPGEVDDFCGTLLN